MTGDNHSALRLDASNISWIGARRIFEREELSIRDVAAHCKPTGAPSRSPRPPASVSDETSEFSSVPDQFPRRKFRPMNLLNVNARGLVTSTMSRDLLLRQGVHLLLLLAVLVRMSKAEAQEQNP